MIILAALGLAVAIPALAVAVIWLHLERQARHDALRQAADADRAVDWDGLIGFQHSPLILRKDGE